MERLLPSIPEGESLPEQPADPQEHRLDEEEPEGHILGGRWRRAAAETQRLFDKKRRRIDIILYRKNFDEKS